MSPVRLALPVVLLAAVAGCWTHTIGGPAQGTSGERRDAGMGTDGSRRQFEIMPTRNQLDLLFVIDDSGDDAAQQKLAAQLPVLVQALEALPSGLPDLHVGVISTDMGAGPQHVAGCTPTGKGGQLQSAPRGACTDSTLTPGATFVSAAGDVRNFTAPLEEVLQCITPVGTGGCPFPQPLAAVLRALGADGARPPDGNLGFLRSGAALGIVILSAHDDCSPAQGNTNFFKTDSTTSGLSDPLGPLDSYRCNRYGHLCQESGGSMLIGMPPLVPPASATGTPPVVELANCTADDLPGGPLMTISDAMARLQYLKSDPNSLIFISAITGPPAPYGIEWLPAGAANPQNPNELWPSLMLSCGAAGDPALNPSAMDLSSDGSQGEPALRLARFAQSTAYGVSRSICQPSYGDAMAEIANRLGLATRGLKCIGAAVPMSARQQPDCTVVATYRDAMNATLQMPISRCAPDAAMDVQAPCWRSAYDTTLCPTGGTAIEVIPDASLQSAAGLFYEVDCAVCDATKATPDCP